MKYGHVKHHKYSRFPLLHIVSDYTFAISRSYHQHYDTHPSQLMIHRAANL